MNGDATRGRTAPLFAFFAIVYGVTWGAFLSAGAAGGAFPSTLPIPAGLKWPLLLIGAFAPSLTALALTARLEGRAAALRLFARLARWRVGVRWYLFALGFLAAVKLVAAAAHRILFGAWPAFGVYPAWYVVLAGSLVAAVFGGPLGEEIGWRGYALPRLRELLGERSASLLLGLLWALWHWPVFFIPGMDQFGQPLLPYVTYVSALSVAFAFLDRNSGGSLLLAVLFHTAVNQSKDLVPTRLPAGADSPWALSFTPVQAIFLTLLWIAALAMLASFRRRDRPNLPT